MARQSISDDLYKRRKADVGKSTANETSESDTDTDDEDLISNDSLGLPPPSSDRRKWWLDGDNKLARSDVAPPKNRDGIPMALNPRRPANPFTPTEEQDWVSIPRSLSHMSMSTTLSSSPYEHINMSMISTSGSSPTPRRLIHPSSLSSATSNAPPPGNGFGSATGSKDGDWRDRLARLDTGGSQPPPPPLPRRQPATAVLSGGSGQVNGDAKSPAPALRTPSSAISLLSQAHSHGSVKGAPPPVAKKPAHLSSPRSNQGDTSSTGIPINFAARTAVDSASLASRPATQAAGSVSSSWTQPSAPPAPPKPASMAGAKTLPGMMAGGGGLGYRSPKLGGGRNVDDLLGSLGDDDVELSSWGALQPDPAPQ